MDSDRVGQLHADDPGSLPAGLIAIHHDSDFRQIIEKLVLYG